MGIACETVVREAFKALWVALIGLSVQHAKLQVGNAIKRAASAKVLVGCSFVGDRMVE
jgi:hypothetical protein